MRKQLIYILIVLGIVSIACNKEHLELLTPTNEVSSLEQTPDSVVLVLDSTWGSGCVIYRQFRWYEYYGPYPDFMYDTIVARVQPPCAAQFVLPFPDPYLLLDTCYEKYCLEYCEETLSWFVGEVNPGNPAANNRILDLITINQAKDPCYQDPFSPPNY